MTACIIAIAGCTALEKIVIPEGLTLSKGLFQDCSSLTSVTLKGVTQATRIKIRPTNMGSTPNYQRWHLDNIRIIGM